MAKSFSPDTGGTLPTNLVSYWNLDESSDGTGAVTRVDQVDANTNDLTDNNTTASATGKVSLGADFESTNSEYFSITDASQTGLDVSGDWSVFFWVKWETTPALDTQMWMISKDGAQRQYYWSLYNNGGTLMFNWNASTNGSSMGGTAQRNWTPTAGTWYNVGFTYAASASDVQFYVDGAALGAVIDVTITSIFNGNADFTLGAYSDGTGNVDGVIDEVGFWSKVLTSTEITDLYNGGNGNTYRETSATTFRRRMLVGIGA